MLDELDDTVQVNTDFISETLTEYSKHLSIMHFNTQSMVTSFSESQILVSQLSMDIITMSPPDWLDAFESLLAHLTISWDGLLFLTGDTNIDMLKPSDKLTKQYRSILEAFGCYQHVTKPTRITRTSKTLIDHIVTNNRSCITATDVIPGWLISDHEGIFACVNVRVPRYQPQYKWIRLEKNLNANIYLSTTVLVFLCPLFTAWTHQTTWCMGSTHYLGSASRDMRPLRG